MSVTPRIDISQLPQFSGRTVHLVGRVVQQGNQTFTIESSKGKQVNIEEGMESEMSATVGAMVDIIATILTDSTARELWKGPLSENFDLALYEEALVKVQEFPELFPMTAEDGA